MTRVTEELSYKESFSDSLSEVPKCGVYGRTSESQRVGRTESGALSCVDAGRAGPPDSSFRFLPSLSPVPAISAVTCSFGLVCVSSV